MDDRLRTLRRLQDPQDRHTKFWGSFESIQEADRWLGEDPALIPGDTVTIGSTMHVYYEGTWAPLNGGNG